MSSRLWNMNVRINGISYQGPHAGGVACGILLMNLGIVFSVMSIVVIIVGTQISDLWPMWVAGVATLVISVSLLITGVVVMKLYLKKIQQDVNQTISDIPVVSGYHPRAVDPSAPPPPYPGHEGDVKLGPFCEGPDPPPYPGHQV